MGFWGKLASAQKAMIVNGTSAKHHMRALSNETLALSMVVRASKIERLSPAEQVQQRVFLYVADANNMMRAKLQAPDLYRQSAVRSKYLQHRLLESAAARKSQEFGEKYLSSEPLSRHQKQQDQEQEASNKQLSTLERLEVKMERLE